MNDYRTIVGLDVHKKTIVAAVLPDAARDVTEKVTLENESKVIKKFVNRITTNGSGVFVYEAGPCGYEVHRQITQMGHRCVVIAPSLTPVRPGDRVKTDSRDAAKLARLYRAGELTEIRVPSREEEAARDLVRAREDVLSDRLRARHRLSTFLLRQGRVFREGKSWGVAHGGWAKAQRFEWVPLQQSFESAVRAVEEADARMAVLDQQVLDTAQKEPYATTVRHLRALKGIDTLSAFTLVVEAQDFTRFATAPHFMGYTGTVCSEFSSGDRIRRGGITKAGNAHIRRILVEAAWSYRLPNRTSLALALRRKECPIDVVQIAKRAQDRLHRKFGRLVSKGKANPVAVVAVARELAGFVWAIARKTPMAVCA